VFSWAQGVELYPDERELKQAQDAQVADANDEENNKLMTSVPNSQERTAETLSAVTTATLQPWGTADGMTDPMPPLHGAPKDPALTNTVAFDQKRQAILAHQLQQQQYVPRYFPIPAH